MLGAGVLGMLTALDADGNLGGDKGGRLGSVRWDLWGYLLWRGLVKMDMLQRYVRSS